MEKKMKHEISAEEIRLPRLAEKNGLNAYQSSKSSRNGGAKNRLSPTCQLLAATAQTFRRKCFEKCCQDGESNDSPGFGISRSTLKRTVAKKQWPMLAEFAQYSITFYWLFCFGASGKCSDMLYDYNIYFALCKILSSTYGSFCKWTNTS